MLPHTPPDPEVFYYKLIENPRPVIMVLGDQGEQWTSAVLAFFEKNNVPVFFFPWSKLVNVRSSLNLVYYPVTQCWNNGKLELEVIGYQTYELRKFIGINN